MKRVICLFLGMVVSSLFGATPTAIELAERFPTLNIPTLESVTIETVASRLELDAALTGASKKILLLKEGEVPWSGGTLTLNATNASAGIWLIGDLEKPAVLPFSLNIAGGVVGLANLTIEGASSTGLVISNGRVAAEAIVITKCVVNLMTYACGLACTGGNVTITDASIVNNETAATRSNGIRYSAVFGTSALTLINCVIAGNKGGDGGAVFVQGHSTLGSPTLKDCTVSATFNFDPEFVALPSGPSQVYLGWKSVFGMGETWIEQQVEAEWHRVTDGLVVTPKAEALEDAFAKSLAPTVDGWNSARHEGRTPGTSQTYRLCYTSTMDNATYRTEPITVTLETLSIPQLHSRAEANLRIYLDFTGYIFDHRGDVFNARPRLGAETTYVRTAPFVYEGDERVIEEGVRQYRRIPTETAIQRIWAMVAEDFAPFDVDVTTVAPPLADLKKDDADDERYGVRVIIGFTTTAEGNLVNWFSDEDWIPLAGGLSSWGSFNAYADLPAFVFADSSCQNIAAQITHEVGHTLGVNHDGGTLYYGGQWEDSDGYYSGREITLDGQLNETGYIVTNLRWYPIMGGVPTSTKYLTATGDIYYCDDYDFMNQWSRGDYANGRSDKASIARDETEEDDLAIILGLWKGKTYRTGNNYDDYGLRLLADEAGDTIASATPLTFATTQVAVDGIIGKHIQDEKLIEDVDLYSFIQPTIGPVMLSVEPNYQGVTRGCSLMAKVELLNRDGDILYERALPLAEEDQYSPNVRNAELSIAELPAGYYTVRVSGTVMRVQTMTPPEGERAPWDFNDATNYGSIGPYTLTVTRAPTDRPIVAQQALDAFLLKTQVEMKELKGFAGTRILTQEEIHAALECFLDDGLCTATEDGVVTVAYDFRVTGIAFVAGDCHVTVKAMNSAEQPLDVVTSANFRLVTVDGEVLNTHSRTMLTPQADGSFILSFPTEALPSRLFSVQITCSPEG